jgi:hypothetical protein
VGMVGSGAPQRILGRNSQKRLKAVMGRPLSTREFVALTGAKAEATVEAGGAYITAKYAPHRADRHR